MLPGDPFNEKELLSQLAADDKAAFDRLYHHFEPRLRLFLYPFVASDEHTINTILQDVFVKLWFKRHDLTGIAFLEYYLQRMAKNRLLDILKLSQIKEKHERQFAQLQPSAVEWTTDQVQLKEYMAIAREGLTQLPERRRLIFSLYVLDGLSMDEVAARLDISRDVVKKQLHLSRQFLKEYISTRGDLPLTISGLILVAVFS